MQLSRVPNAFSRREMAFPWHKMVKVLEGVGFAPWALFKKLKVVAYKRNPAILKPKSVILILKSAILKLKSIVFKPKSAIFKLKSAILN